MLLCNRQCVSIHHWWFPLWSLVASHLTLCRVFKLCQVSKLPSSWLAHIYLFRVIWTLLVLDRSLVSSRLVSSRLVSSCLSSITWRIGMTCLSDRSLARRLDVHTSNTYEKSDPIAFINEAIFDRLGAPSPKSMTHLGRRGPWALAFGVGDLNLFLLTEWLPPHCCCCSLLSVTSKSCPVMSIDSLFLYQRTVDSEY